MRKKYNVNLLTEDVKDFHSRHLAAYWTDSSGGGYIIEIYNPDSDWEWEEAGGIERSIKDVISWAKKWYGWRKAAKLKEAIWSEHHWNLTHHRYDDEDDIS